VSTFGIELDEELVGTPPAAEFLVLEPREVPLGGPRALPVRRTLPQKARSLIGAWCFLDSYGPETKPMVVPPHPHTGLSTVSWLFSGEIEHRDSTGAHALVRPGEMNLMTAGRGIQHSEVSTDGSHVLHGAQLWLALPAAQLGIDPFFEHYVPEPFDVDGATVRVFLGELLGFHSTATTFSPLVGAQLDLLAGATLDIPVDASFEHGVLVDTGRVRVNGEALPEAHLGYVPPGRDTIRIEAESSSRLLLIGGKPLGEQIVMWWNFVGRSHDEIVEARRQWTEEIATPGLAERRYGRIPNDPLPPLPAPEMPHVRLRPRG
jgi:redox-sensitive bicupin YhaK (pirin superfamily)